MDIERIVVRMMADASQYNRVMHGVEGQLMGLGKTVGAMGSMLNVPIIAGVGALTSLSVATVAAAGYAVKLAADYERASVAFTVMTGSAEISKNIIAEINQLAIESPFKAPELMEGAKSLKAFGFETDQLLPVLRALGEVSSGTGTKLERIILAFGQIRVAGRLMGPELRQLVDAGVPIFEYLSKVMGKPTQAIKGLVEEGKVGFPDVARAFNAMTKDGGLFFNMMEKQSQTAMGRWNAFTETIELKLRDVGLAFFEGFGIADLLEKARAGTAGGLDHDKMVSMFKGWKEDINEVWIGIKAVYATIVGILKASRDWAKENEKLLRDIGKIALITGGVLLTTYLVYSGLVLLVTVIGALISPMGLLIIGVTSLVTLLDHLGAFEGLGDTLTESFRHLGEVSSQTWKGVKDAINAGNMELAFKIVFKGIEYGFKVLLLSLEAEWTRFVANLLGKGSVRSYIGSVSALVINDVMATAARVFNTMPEAEIQKRHEQVKNEVIDKYHGENDVKKAELELEIQKIMARADPLKAELDKLTGQAGREVSTKSLSSYEKDIIETNKTHKELMDIYFGMRNIQNEDLLKLVPGSEDYNRKKGRVESTTDSMLKEIDRFNREKKRIEDKYAVPFWERTAADIAGMPSGTGYGGIRIPLAISSDTMHYMGELRREMDKELKGGIGTASGQLDFFNKNVKMLEEGYYGPLGTRKQAFSGMLGGLATAGVQGVAIDEEFQFGMFREYNNLRKWVTGRSEDNLPKAMARGSAESQDTINRSNQQQTNLLEEIRNTFLRAEILQTEQRDYQKAMVENLKKVLEERQAAGKPAVMGFFNEFGGGGDF